MITNESIITFPVLFEPKPNLSGDMKYSCSLLIPKTDTDGVALINAEIDKAIAKGKTKIWGGSKPKFRYEPLRDGDDELASGDKKGSEYKGHYFINASANEDRPPGVVDAKVQPLMDRNALYSGCIVRCDINAFPYKSGGNSGIGWGLNNVMLVKDGDRLDGRLDAVDAFSAFKKSEVKEDNLV